ncbi:MAG: hypothetical protein J6J60_01630 [Clostridia bacterium]|nr:hypothetical protein [Clostridia bacterium]
MNQKNKISRKKLILKILIICIITSILSIELTLAGYKSSTNLMSAATVALMANNTTIEIENNLEGYPGCEPIVCPIILTNVKDNKVCKVGQKYSIYVDRTQFQNIPLEFSLYKDENCTEILAPNENLVYTDESFIFEAGVETSITYYLKVEWPEDKNNSDFAFEVEYFKINVDVEQID